MANLQLIKTLAKERGITLRDLASRAKITEAGLFKLIKENTTSVGTLESIASVLNVSPAVFFNDDKPVTATDTDGGAIAVAGDDNITLSKAVLDMLAAKDARITELTNKLLDMCQRA